MQSELDTSLIDAELEQVLSSRCFRSRRSLKRLLSYLVKQTPLDKKQQLTQHQIAVEVFGKATDFDSGIDPLVRVQVGRLRKQLDEYYATEGRHNVLQIKLKKGSYQPTLSNKTSSNHHPILSEIHTAIFSQGPSLLCVPRSFTQDKEKDWLYINQFGRDYVKSLRRFSFCQILLAGEIGESACFTLDSGQQSGVDFVQLLDLYDDEKGFSLKSSLVQTHTQQIIWALSLSLGTSYPEPGLLNLIFKRLAHEIVAYDPGIIHSHWARQLLDSSKPIAAQHQVLVAVRQFIWTNSASSFAQSFRSCQQRLEAFPQDVIALFVYANHCFTEYAMKFNVIVDPKTKIIRVSSLMLQLAPDNPYSQLYYALACLFREDYDACRLALEQAQTLNALDSYLDVQLGLIYLALGDWELGATLLQGSINLSPNYPDWYHIPLCICHFQQGHYLKAMQEAKNIRLKHFWTPMLRTALLHCTNKLEQGRHEYLKLVDDYPDFVQASQQVMHYLPSSAHQVLQQLWAHIPALPKKP